MLEHNEGVLEKKLVLSDKIVISLKISLGPEDGTPKL